MRTEALLQSPQVREPHRIGRYHVLNEIGRGGMGVVYRAEDHRIGRQVAVKTLTELTPELLERFYVEARSGIVSHPNIVTVYELGEHEGVPFIAMEFIDGDSLEQMLVRRKKLPLLEAIAIVEQLCAGLGYAHGHGVVHRDIKPANVLVRPDGRVTIVDFGIARLADRTQALTKVDTLLGTFHYIAPERLKGEAGDGRADVWSAGVILYELITGHLPFKGSAVSAVYRVLHEPYVPVTEHMPDTPEALTRVLDRALDKNAETRYATAEQMAFDLQALAEGFKHDRAAVLLETAHTLVKDGNFVNARAVLLQAQRISPNDTAAKVLLSEVQEQLGSAQRLEQLRQAREAAEQAVAELRWEQAVPLLEQALRLDTRSEHDLNGRLESARENRERQRQAAPEATALRKTLEEEPQGGETRLLTVPAPEMIELEGQVMTRALHAGSCGLDSRLGEEGAGDDRATRFSSSRDLAELLSQQPAEEAAPAAEEDVCERTQLSDSPAEEREAPSPASQDKMPGPQTMPLRKAFGAHAKPRWIRAVAALSLGVPLLTVVLVHARRETGTRQAAAAIQYALGRESFRAQAKAHSVMPPIKAAPVAASPDLMISASPWATVVDVKRKSGGSVALPKDRTTPLRLELAEAGEYEVRLVSAAGQQHILRCTASPTEPPCSTSFNIPSTARLLRGER